jgi:formylglycine-generating enzyme required for sulfatase activity
MNACSSGGLHAFPYGDVYDATACDTWNNPTSGCNAGTCVSIPAGSLATCQAVGAYAGVFDLSGNLFEWSDSVIGDGSVGYKARTRGASFTTFSQDDRCDMDDHTPVNGTYDNVGFRCCSP